MKHEVEKRREEGNTGTKRRKKWKEKKEGKKEITRMKMVFGEDEELFFKNKERKNENKKPF